MRGSLRDYTGIRFNHLVGLRMIGADKNGTKWWWRCDCGTEIARYANNVYRGSPKSCGCDKKRNPNGHPAAVVGRRRKVPELTGISWLGTAAPAVLPGRPGRVVFEGRTDGLSIKAEITRDLDEIAEALQEYVEPQLGE